MSLSIGAPARKTIKRHGLHTLETGSPCRMKYPENSLRKPLPRCLPSGRRWWTGGSAASSRCCGKMPCRSLRPCPPSLPAALSRPTYTEGRRIPGTRQLSVPTCGHSGQCTRRFLQSVVMGGRQVTIDADASSVVFGCSPHAPLPDMPLNTQSDHGMVPRKTLDSPVENLETSWRIQLHALRVAGPGKSCLSCVRRRR